MVMEGRGKSKRRLGFAGGTTANFSELMESGSFAC